MSRRASLPGADELFRSTAAAESQQAAEEPPASEAGANPTSLQVAMAMRRQDERKPRHDEKVTFYCTAGELTRLERARLGLRAEFHLPTDRGRIVRAALAEILEDFEARGDNSALVKRLQREPRD